MTGEFKDITEAEFEILQEVLKEVRYINDRSGYGSITVSLLAGNFNTIRPEFTRKRAPVKEKKDK